VATPAGRLREAPSIQGRTRYGRASKHRGTISQKGWIITIARQIKRLTSWDSARGRSDGKACAYSKGGFRGLLGNTTCELIAMELVAAARVQRACRTHSCNKVKRLFSSPSDPGNRSVNLSFRGGVDGEKG